MPPHRPSLSENALRFEPLRKMTTKHILLRRWVEEGRFTRVTSYRDNESQPLCSLYVASSTYRCSRRLHWGDRRNHRFTKGERVLGETQRPYHLVEVLSQSEFSCLATQQELRGTYYVHDSRGTSTITKTDRWPRSQLSVHTSVVGIRSTEQRSAVILYHTVYEGQ